MTHPVRSHDRVGRVFKELCVSFDTPRSLAAWLLYDSGEHKQLAQLSINPSDYLHHWDFYKDYIISKYLSKYKGLKTGVDLRGTALQKFNDSEASCKSTNTRLRQARLEGISPSVSAVIFTAQRKIASLITPGGERNLSWFDLFEGCRWGPGVTFSLRGEDATLDRKIGEYPISVTSGALPYLRAVIEADPHWGEAMFHCEVGGPFSLIKTAFNVVEGCRVTTVDKDAKSDRTIAIEPTGNVFLQLGIGRYLRKRLLRVGINLDDQKINQGLALQASKTGELATVDLSAASDSISTELVYELLPVDWAILLDQIRSRKALIDGQWQELEKFSSMGNGFTFELETLIFWALSSACVEVLGLQGLVAVYGDDIVLPTQAYHLLTEVFHHVGFTINMEKSYANGYFRESCGKHYWAGYDVTPVYQREECTTLDTIYRGANRLLRLAYKLGGDVGWHSALRPSVAAMIRGVKIRHFIPWYQLGPKGQVEINQEDVGLLSPMRVVYLKGQELAPKLKWDPFQDFASTVIQMPVLSFRPKKVKIFNERSLLAYWLRFLPEEPFEGAVPVRRKGRYVIRRRRFLLSNITDVAWL